MRTLLLVPLLVAGCGGEGDLSTHDRIVDTQIDAMNDFGEVVRGIRSPVDVELARPTIEQIVKRMEEAQAAVGRLGEAGTAEKKRLEEKVEVASRRLQPLMEKAMQALRNDPQAVAALLVLTAEVMSKLGAVPTHRPMDGTPGGPGGREGR